MRSVRKYLSSTAACLALLNGVACQKAALPQPPASPVLGMWQYEKAGGMFNDAKATMQIVFHPSGTYEWHVQVHGSLTGTDVAAAGRGTWTLENGILTNRDAKGAVEKYALTAHMQNLLTLTVVEVPGSNPGEIQQWRRIGDAEVANADSSAATASPPGTPAAKSLPSSPPPPSTKDSPSEPSNAPAGADQETWARGKAVSQKLWNEDASAMDIDNSYPKADTADYNYYMDQTYLKFKPSAAIAEEFWAVDHGIHKAKHRDWMRQVAAPRRRAK